MSPQILPFLELLPISLIIASVYSAMKEEGVGTIARAGFWFFLRLYGGLILFSVGIHLLCLVVL